MKTDRWGLPSPRPLPPATSYEPVWQSIVPKIGYVCFLPALAVGIVAFLVLKIIPQYEKIFKDFNTRLPDITLRAVPVCRWAVRCGCCWAFLAVAWRGCSSMALLRYAGSIRWDLPGMDRLLRRRHIATVLDALSLAAQRQRPLGEALSTLASSYPQRPIARRLWAAYDDMQAGGDDFNACTATVCSARRTWPCCNRPGETATSPGPRGKWPTATAAASSIASMPCCK